MIRLGSMKVIPVQTKKQKRQFIDFPHTLYAADPNYVPEIYLAQKELLSERKNPFFKHSQAQLFLAVRKDRIVGRIAAIHNRNYNDFAKANAGFFGFFDVIEDYETARSLLDTAVDWIRQRGLDTLYGPANFTTNDTAGVLIEGFDSPPVVMMTYNQPYYVDFLERFGLKKQIDLFAYLITEDQVNVKAMKIMDRLEERLLTKGISIRTVNMHEFDAEARRIRRVYEAAWDENWGFVPPTQEEFEHLAEGLKMIVNKNFVYLAEHDGECIGFVVAIPDINEIMRTVPRGRLLPFGIFKLLFGKGKIKKIRIILLGVLEEYRRLGIEGIFYGKIIKYGLDHGYTAAEASWILENNEMMRKGLEKLNARVYKKYRLYQMTLT